jgi:hypothetical protein
MQEELDFALEIFKVAYQKRKFEGPYVSPCPMTLPAVAAFRLPL